MKRVLACSLAIAAVAAATTVYAGRPAATGINGSLHDMREFVYPGYTDSVDSMDRVCVFCHTPHNAMMDVAGDVSTYPLWNHAGATDASSVSYTPYAWATPLNAGVTDGSDPDNDFTIVGNQAIIGPSRLCLTCHDGTIAVDQHGGNGVAAAGNAAQPGSNMVSARANLATDLSNDHPIGFDYVQIQAYRDAHSGYTGNGAIGKEIAVATSTFAEGVTVQPDAFANQGKYNTVGRFAAGNRRIVDVLYEQRYMTCATCHEVHNKDNVTQSAFTGVNGTDTSKAPNFFLYAKEQDSLICLSCHVK